MSVLHKEKRLHDQSTEQVYACLRYPRETGILAYDLKNESQFRS